MTNRRGTGAQGHGRRNRRCGSRCAGTLRRGDRIECCGLLRLRGKCQIVAHRGICGLVLTAGGGKNESAIERMSRDARVQAIGGGATEVMLEEVAKRL